MALSQDAADPADPGVGQRWTGADGKEEVAGALGAGGDSMVVAGGLDAVGERLVEVGSGRGATGEGAELSIVAFFLIMGLTYIN
jgi:hypothetical protein